MARSCAGLRIIGSVLPALAVGICIAMPTEAATPTQSATPAAEAYTPGLGDFMTAYVQPHHIKLWLAGSTGNWKLAAYEADELGETFDDVATYQATWKGVAVAQLLKGMIEPALKKVNSAIAARNVADFKSAYGTLTAACNSCHMAAQHDFLEIKVPTADPFPDQNFAVH
jgi:hypothetical protein